MSLKSTWWFHHVISFLVARCTRWYRHVVLSLVGVVCIFLVKSHSSTFDPWITRQSLTGLLQRRKAAFGTSLQTLGNDTNAIADRASQKDFLEVDHRAAESRLGMRAEMGVGIGCGETIRRVEAELFRNLSWEDALNTADRLRSSDPSCSMTSPICLARAAARGIQSLADFRDLRKGSRKPNPHRSPHGAEESCLDDETGMALERQTVNVTMYDRKRIFFEVATRPESQMGAWLRRLSARRRKTELVVMILGDSTMRGLASHLMYIFAGKRFGYYDIKFQGYHFVVETEGGFRLVVEYIVDHNCILADAIVHHKLNASRADLIAFNIGFHCMHVPYTAKNTRKGRLQRTRSLFMRSGGHVETFRKLIEAVPKTASIVYTTTDHVCEEKRSPEYAKSFSEASIDESDPKLGYLQKTSGSKLLNRDVIADVLPHAVEGLGRELPVRLLDSFALTHDRCQFAEDALHYDHLYTFKAASLLMDLAAVK